MSWLLYIIIAAFALFMFPKFAVVVAGIVSPLSYSIPQLIKDKARARNISVEAIPWAFFEQYGSIIVSQAKLLSPRKMDQAQFASECVHQLVTDMDNFKVKTPSEWEEYITGLFSSHLRLGYRGRD